MTCFRRKWSMPIYIDPAICLIALILLRPAMPLSAMARFDSPIRIRTRMCRYWYISNLRFAMRIVLAKKQPTIRELNESLSGNYRKSGSIAPQIRWIDYGANRVALLRRQSNGSIWVAINT